MKPIDHPTLKLIPTMALALVAYYILIELIYSQYIIPLELSSKRVGLGWLAKAIETSLLGWVFLVLLLLSKRALFAFVAVTLMYLVFIVSNVVKINYLGLPLFPVDFTQVDDLIRTKEVFFQFVPWIVLTTVVLGWAIRWLFKHTKPAKWTGATHCLAALLLVGPVMLLSQFHPQVEGKLREHNIFLKKNTDQIRRSIKSGWLNYFTQSLVMATDIPPPAGYSAAAIDQLAQRHRLFQSSPKPTTPDNIILILVESLTDPAELGWQTTLDPLSNFRRHRAQQPPLSLISPVLGGKSINAEFETLTGMSVVFTPPSSLPFREAVSNTIPSIPNELKKLGFHSTAIQQVSMDGFGYERIFEYLGFDLTIAMPDTEFTEMDHLNRYSSVDALFQQVIKSTQANRKSFVYAFSNTTHSPWRAEDFPGSALALVSDSGVDPATEQIINGYLNAIHDFDQALGRLIDHYAQLDESTLIVVAGDHQPHLTTYRRFHAPPITTYQQQVLTEYTVPLMVWSNGPLHWPDNQLHSMNYVPALLFELIQVEPQGLIKLSKKLRQHTPIFTQIMGSERGVVDNQETHYTPLIRDYEMLQYDVLFGDNHLPHSAANHSN